MGMTFHVFFGTSFRCGTTAILPQSFVCFVVFLRTLRGAHGCTQLNHEADKSNDFKVFMVRTTGIEPVTPTVSR